MLPAPVATFKQFYPDEPPDIRPRLSLVPSPKEPTPEALHEAPPPTQTPPQPDRLHELADTRIAGLHRLRAFVRSRPGMDLDIFLREIKKAEDEVKAQMREEEKKVREIKRRQKEAAREPFGARFVSEFGKIAAIYQAILKLDERIRRALRECRADLEGLRKEALAEHEAQWALYIDSLAGSEHDNLAGPLRAFWDWISKELWAPEGSPFDDGFLMTWDHYQHRLQVVLSPDGSFDWSYYNRDTQEYISEEELGVGQYTDAFKQAIARVIE